MMTPLIFLVMLVLGVSRTAGDGGVQIYDLQAAIGSSVFLPGVKIDEYSMYDMKKVNGGIVWTCHGGCTVMGSFAKRGQLHPHNGTFLLNDLRAEDGGTFQLTTNFTVKMMINLHVMAPVTSQLLLKQEEYRNGSQCLIVFTCQAEGDGSLNFTFLRNGQVMHQVVSTDNSSSMSMDSWDPETSGRISCSVTNPVSSKTSPIFDLLRPATLTLQIWKLFAIASLHHWVFSLCILCKRCISRKLTEREQKGNDYNEAVNSKSKKSKDKCKDCNFFFYTVDNLLAILKELVLVFICLDGSVIPWWCCLLPGAFLLCRLIVLISAINNKEEETCMKISPDFRIARNLAVEMSNFLVIPAFSIAILVRALNRSPCGTMDRYPSYLSAVCVTFFVIYLVMKNIDQAKKQEQTQRTDHQQLVKAPNGDIERAEDNRNPNCEGPDPGFEDNPSIAQATPKQSDGHTVEDPEDPMIPKPEEGQPSEDHKTSTTTSPNLNNPDGTRNQGQCIVTLEKEVVTFHKDREANG